ncbi:MAG: hypothetical protein RR746_06010 [Lachnospiraceae bacterium]
MVGRNGEVFEGREIDEGGVGEVENNIDMYKIKKMNIIILHHKRLKKTEKWCKIILHHKIQ